MSTPRRSPTGPASALWCSMPISSSGRAIALSYPMMKWTGRPSYGRCRRAETGMKTVSLLAEAPNWINYDLPPALVGIALKGKYRGQTQKWFAYEFTGDESEIAINPPPGGHTAEFDAWEWKNMTELPDLIVPFKRTVYEQVVAAFKHLAG
eukprot:gene25882-31081_t